MMHLVRLMRLNTNVLCATLLCALFSTACSNVSPVARGLSPKISAKDVKTSSDDRQIILAALQKDAGVDVNSPDWYQVTLSGFNYVDDSCSEYFDELFKLNRKREALKTGLTATGQTTNAILTVTSASKLSIGIVAQAFGLTSSLTDVVAGSYLYQLPPAPTKKFVDALLHAYRVGAAAKQSEIKTSPALAYTYIRGYLNLCLPTTIEGELINHIGSAKAKPENIQEKNQKNTLGATKTEISDTESINATGVTLKVYSPDQ